MTLKSRILAAEPLLGTFIKTPHYHVVEVLSRSPLDVLCLDAEHVAFDRSDLDASVLAARANNQPILIRTTDDRTHTILNALDIGADGVVIPHVKSASQLEKIAQACHYGPQGRGYAGSTRFANYTKSSVTDNLARAKSVAVIAQIEDLAALDDIEQIAAVEGVDCLFIGRMDLTIALGETNPKAHAVVDAVERIVHAAKKHQRTVGMFVGDLSELNHWKEQGVSVFLLSSDHSFMLQGAQQLRTYFDQA